MPDIRWPQSPLLSVTGRHGRGGSYPHYDATWNDDPNHFAAQFGSAGGSVLFNVRLISNSTSGSTLFRVQVEKLNTSNQPIQNVSNQQHWVNNGAPLDLTLGAPVTDHWTRFRVTLQVFHVHHYSQSGTGWDEWYDPESRVLTLFTKYYGEFSLEYVPITILYCPPGQDMTSSFYQSEEYGTVFSIGLNSTVGNTWGSSQTVKGGARIGVGVSKDVGAGVEVNASSTDEYRNSQSIENTSANIIGTTYEWGSRVIADNQRAIGRAFWGPLGDIFVLLKNPWFEVTGDLDDNIGLGISENTRYLTHLLMIPAHKLLRPDGDPIASLIPAATRRRLLELDPFITNLDRFFPADQGDELKTAANPHADPSFTSSGANRAALIARYSIDTGVVLDLSHSEAIKVDDSRTNATTYRVEVSEIDSVDVTAFLNVVTAGGLLIGGSIGGGSTSSHSAYTEVAYLSSHETYLRQILTAQCSLIRNQNEADLDDIEVWWDKIFSTFMFRRVDPSSTMTLGGRIEGPYGIVDRLQNIPVELIIEKLREHGVPTEPPTTLHTMTDHLGRYAFRNITIPGKYVLKAGDKSTEGKITKTQVSEGAEVVVHLQGVKKTLDLKKSAVWELMDAMNASRQTTLQVASTLSKEKNVDENKLGAVLAKHKIKLPDLMGKVVPRYPPRVR